MKNRRAALSTFRHLVVVVKVEHVQLLVVGSKYYLWMVRWELNTRNVTASIWRGHLLLESQGAVHFVNSYRTISHTTCNKSFGIINIDTSRLHFPVFFLLGVPGKTLFLTLFVDCQINAHKFLVFSLTENSECSVFTARDHSFGVSFSSGHTPSFVVSWDSFGSIMSGSKLFELLSFFFNVDLVTLSTDYKFAVL